MRYDNPRTRAEIHNWPSGRYTTTALFSIERHPTRGERGVRVTHHPKTGRPAAPKKLTYARTVRIVDGNDGRLYFAEKHHYGEGISIMQGTMQYQHEVLYPGDADYQAALALFD